MRNPYAAPRRRKARSRRNPWYLSSRRTILGYPFKTRRGAKASRRAIRKAVPGRYGRRGPRVIYSRYKFGPWGVAMNPKRRAKTRRNPARRTRSRFVIRRPVRRMTRRWRAAPWARERRWGEIGYRAIRPRMALNPRRRKTAKRRKVTRRYKVSRRVSRKSGRRNPFKFTLRRRARVMGVGWTPRKRQAKAIVRRLKRSWGARRGKGWSARIRRVKHVGRPLRRSVAARRGIPYRNPRRKFTIGRGRTERRVSYGTMRRITKRNPHYLFKPFEAVGRRRRVRILKRGELSRARSPWTARRRGTRYSYIAGPFRTAAQARKTRKSIYGYNPLRRNPSKFDLVSQIEQQIGVPTEKLWKANKATLEALAKKCRGNPARRRRNPWYPAKYRGRPTAVFTRRLRAFTAPALGVRIGRKKYQVVSRADWLNKRQALAHAKLMYGRGSRRGGATWKELQRIGGIKNPARRRRNPLTHREYTSLRTAASFYRDIARARGVMGIRDAEKKSKGAFHYGVGKGMWDAAGMYGPRTNPARRARRRTRVTRARYVRERLMSPKKFDPRSFRTVTTKRGRRIVIGCPTGHYDARTRRCRVGTRAQSILRPIRGAAIRKIRERLKAVANPRRRRNPNVFYDGKYITAPKVDVQRYGSGRVEITPYKLTGLSGRPFAARGAFIKDIDNNPRRRASRYFKNVAKRRGARLHRNPLLMSVFPNPPKRKAAKRRRNPWYVTKGSPSKVLSGPYRTKAMAGRWSKWFGAMMGPRLEFSDKHGVAEGELLPHPGGFTYRRTRRNPVTRAQKRRLGRHVTKARRVVRGLARAVKRLKTYRRNPYLVAAEVRGYEHVRPFKSRSRALSLHSRFMKSGYESKFMKVGAPTYKRAARAWRKGETFRWANPRRAHRNPWIATVHHRRGRLGWQPIWQSGYIKSRSAAEKKARRYVGPGERFDVKFEQKRPYRWPKFGRLNPKRRVRRNPRPRWAAQLGDRYSDFPAKEKRIVTRRLKSARRVPGSIMKWYPELKHLRKGHALKRAQTRRRVQELGRARFLRKWRAGRRARRNPWYLISHPRHGTRPVYRHRRVREMRYLDPRDPRPRYAPARSGRYVGGPYFSKREATSVARRMSGYPLAKRNPWYVTSHPRYGQGARTVYRKRRVRQDPRYARTRSGASYVGGPYSTRRQAARVARRITRRYHRNPGFLATAAMAGPIASWWVNALKSKKSKRRYHRNPPTRSSAVPMREGGKMPVEKFEQWLTQSGTAQDKRGYEAAKKKFRDLHLGSEPKSIGYTKTQLDGDSKVRGRSFMISMGKVPATYYETPKYSGKKGKSYVHEWKRGREPELLVDPSGKHIMMNLKGGSQSATRGWLRG